MAAGNGGMMETINTPVIKIVEVMIDFRICS